jgi:hypothetical protein
MGLTESINSEDHINMISFIQTLTNILACMMETGNVVQVWIIRTKIFV